MKQSPDSLTFCLLSFEGPDRYPSAGGLGVRVTHLADTIAARGFTTHLLFVGDPAAPGRETKPNGRLTLHRWCQWISAHHPLGVYDGEEAKLWDFNESAPSFVIEQIVRPAVVQGKLIVVPGTRYHHLLNPEGVQELYRQPGSTSSRRPPGSLQAGCE